MAKGILPPLLVTFGLSIIIQNLLLEIFSADSRGLNSAPCCFRFSLIGSLLP
jgi:branched-chain amino acid transport system permease protein